MDLEVLKVNRLVLINGHVNPNLHLSTSSLLQWLVSETYSFSMLAAIAKHYYPKMVQNYRS